MYNWLDDDAQEGRGGDRGGRALGFLGRRVHTWHEYRALPHFGGGGIVETELQIREDPKRRPVRRVQCHPSLPEAICLVVVVATDIFAPSAKNNCEFFGRSGVTVASAAAPRNNERKKQLEGAKNSAT